MSSERQPRATASLRCRRPGAHGAAARCSRSYRDRPAPLDERHPDVDRGPPARRGTNRKAAADPLDTLCHADQPEPLAPRARDVEADAVVFDGEVKRVTFARESDRDAVSAA